MSTKEYKDKLSVTSVYPEREGGFVLKLWTMFVLTGEVFYFTGISNIFRLLALCAEY